MDPYRKLILALMILTISRIHQHFGFLNTLRPLLILTVGATIYAYLNPRYLASGSLFKTWPAKLMAGLALMACLSAPFGLSLGGSARFIIDQYSKVILFAFLVLAAIRTAQDLYTMVWGFVLACGGLAYLSLFVFKMRRASDDGLLRIQTGYSYDGNDIATVAVIGIPLTLLLLQTATSRGRAVAGAILLGLGATVAKTGSRGGMLGLVAVGIALLISLDTVSIVKRLVFVAVTAVSLGIAAPPGYWEQMRSMLNPKQDYNWTSPSGRRQVFLRGLGYYAMNPVTGIGVDNFPRAEGTLSSLAQAQAVDPNQPGVKWSVAHNSFLESLVEMGTPGFLLFAGLVLGGIFRIGQLRRRLPRQWLTGDPADRFLYFTTLYLPVAFVGFLVSGFFVSFTYYDPLYVLGAFAAGVYVSIEVRLRSATSQPVTRVINTGERGGWRRGGTAP